MADYYVKSSAAGLNNGSDWDNAFTTLQAAISVATGYRDRILVSKNHLEEFNSAVNVTYTISSSMAVNPKIISVDDSVFPATTPEYGARFEQVSAYDINFDGNVTLDGIRIACGTSGTSGGAPDISLARSSGTQTLKNCNFEILGINTGSRITVGSSASGQRGYARIYNCRFRFANVSQGIVVAYIRAEFIGGGFISGTALISDVLKTSNSTVDVLFDSFDFSALGAGVYIWDTGSAQKGTTRLVNCKMPDGWHGNLAEIGAFPDFGMRASLYNCYSDSTLYPHSVSTYAGNIVSSLTVYRTGGYIHNGTLPTSWRMTSHSMAEQEYSLTTDDISFWVDNVGQSITIAFEILQDSTTSLTNHDIWVEVDYPATLNSTFNTTVTDGPSNILNGVSELQTTSAADWVTTGLTNPLKQKLSVTIVPAQSGLISAKIKLAKPDTTVYICPKPEIS